MTVGNPFPDAVASALFSACEQSRIVGNAVEDLLGRWFEGTRGCDDTLTGARALRIAAHVW